MGNTTNYSLPGANKERYAFSKKTGIESTGNYLFADADERILKHMKERIGRKLPNFLAPLNVASEESVQVAYMLNEIINSFHKGARRKTFFCNSHMEAVHGAIKIARQFVKLKDKLYDGTVLFLDASGYYEKYFNPLNVSMREALIPGIEMVERLDKMPGLLQHTKAKIIVISLLEWPNEEYGPISQYCEKNGIIRILDISRLKAVDHGDVEKLPISGFEIVCWGEALTNHHIPFGAFSTTKHIHAIWNNIGNCTLHSSTFGGNGMVLSYVRKNIYDSFPIFTNRIKYRNFLRKISRSDSAKVKGAQHYLNAGIIFLFSSLHISLAIAKAEGSFLYVRSGLGRTRKKIDCIGGSGCNVFGHNKRDIIPEIPGGHKPDFDYFKLLNEKLYETTGLNKMFQAVSGASAVEIGIIIALLAGGAKKKILIFTGNYGGKTLAALNATSANHYYFHPLYSHVQVFDPFAADACVELKKILISGEIALVWMEIIQGRTLRPMPQEILSLVNLYRDEYDYLIGIDEILNGIHRTGQFTSYDPSLIRADVITLAKGLSGMILPVSVALFSGEVYKRAVSRNEAAVHYLENVYKNQLSCHVAVHALEKLRAENISENVKEMSGYLCNGIRDLIKTAPLLESVNAYGLHIHINANLKKFPFRYFGYDMTNFILTRMFYTKGDFLSLFGRLLPPLNLNKEDASQIIKGVEKVFSYHPLYFFWLGLKMIIYRSCHRVTSKLFRY